MTSRSTRNKLPARLAVTELPVQTSTKRRRAPTNASTTGETSGAASGAASDESTTNSTRATRRRRASSTSSEPVSGRYTVEFSIMFERTEIHNTTKLCGLNSAITPGWNEEEFIETCRKVVGEFAGRKDLPIHLISNVVEVMKPRAKSGMRLTLEPSDKTADPYGFPSWQPVEDLVTAVLTETKRAETLVPVKRVTVFSRLSTRLPTPPPPSIPPPPASSQTTAPRRRQGNRTEQLLNQISERPAEEIAKETNIMSLLKRHKCKSLTCRNHKNTCFVDPERGHFRMVPSELKEWQQAIDQGTATADDPPSNILIDKTPVRPGGSNGNQRPASATPTTPNAELGQQLMSSLVQFEALRQVMARPSQSEPPASSSAMSHRPSTPRTIQPAEPECSPMKLGSEDPDKLLAEFYLWNVERYPNRKDKLQEAFSKLSDESIDLEFIRDQKEPSSWSKGLKIGSGLGARLFRDVRGFMTQRSINGAKQLTTIEPWIYDDACSGLPATPAHDANNLRQADGDEEFQNLFVPSESEED